MWNPPTPLQLLKLPRLYSTEKIPLEEKVIHMHFFLGGCDWYAAEYDPNERIFFGYAILNNDLDNAEWGYFSLNELAKVKTSSGVEIDRDLHWKPIKAIKIEKLRQVFGK